MGLRPLSNGNLPIYSRYITFWLFQEYIHKINKSSEWPDVGQYFIEIKPNKIIETNSIDDIISNYLIMHKKPENSIDSGNKLAKKIEDSAEMFVQLEYLARGTDARDVLDGHIKLMSQLARCSSALWSRSTAGESTI